MKGGVCAVVVTYNRQTLLRECLAALRSQTHPLACILVVDNRSTDGTEEMLVQESAAGVSPPLQVITAPENRGGAGGFHDGLQAAAAQEFEWFWLLDDDVIVRPDALEQLLRARASFATEPRPILLASKITLPDGAIDPATIPRLNDRRDMAQMCRAAEHSTLALRLNAFVAVLIHRSAVERYGLPIASYFIWLDDVEYTARILRDNFGVFVPRSVVLHKKATGQADLSGRFYFAVRNELSMIRFSEAWSAEERLRLVGGLVWIILRRLFKPRFTFAKLGVICHGLIDGLFRSPRVPERS